MYISNWIYKLAIIFAGCAMAAIAAPDAHAERIAIAPFTGPGSKTLQKTVRAGLGSKHTVVGSARYHKTARKLGAGKMNARNTRRVAGALKVAGVVVGHVRKKRGRYRMTIGVRSARTGKLVGSTVITSKNYRLTDRQKRTVRRQVRKFIAKLPPALSGTRVAKGKRAKGKRAKKAKKAKSKRAKGKRAKRGKGKRGKRAKPVQVAAVTPARRGDRERTSTGRSMDERRAARAAALDVMAGLGVTTRKMTFAVADGIVDLPQHYRSNPVASMHVEGVVYPMALIDDTRTLRSRFGITGSFDRVMLIESRIAYDDAAGDRMEAGLATDHAAWSLGVAYRHLFGDGERPLSVRGSLALNRLSFTIDRTDVPAGVDVELPNVGYTYFDPGVATWIPVTDKISADVAGNFIIAAGKGDIAADDAYGAGSALGYRLQAALHYQLRPGLTVRAGARYTRIGHSFDGTGVASNGRDGDPATVDVPSATDRYLNVYATAGYRY